MGCEQSIIRENNEVNQQGTVDTRGLICIYYGTTSGNSSRLAFQFADEIEHKGFIPKIINLSEFEPEQIKAAAINVFFVSTYGTGGPTDDGQKFHDWIMSEERTKDFLVGTKYIVFALGSTAHEHFCGMGIKTNDRLTYMGAQSIFPMGKGNAANETTDNDYMQWVAGGLFEALETQFPMKKMSKQEVLEQSSTYKIEFTDKPEVNIHHYDANSVSFHVQKYLESPLLTISEIRELRNNASMGNSTLFINLESTLPYKSAQNLAVYPENSEKNIQLLCQQLNLKPKSIFQVVSKSKHPFPNPITVHQYLQKFCDFLGPISRKQVFELSKLTDNAEDKKAMQFAASHQGRDEFEKEFQLPKHNMLSVLQKYNIRTLELIQLIGLCPLIAPRFFTIASSNTKYPKNIHLIASQLVVKDNRIGICSEYLQSLKAGDKLRCYLYDSAFTYPTQPGVPVILIGPGAGLAPMRAFVQDKDDYIEKDKLGECPFQGPMQLYFGCRTQDDYFFKEELLEYSKNGTLSELKVALSREGNKIYVTQFLLEDLQKLANHIDLGGVIYVCGSQKMGKDIANALEAMFKQIKKVAPYMAYKKVNDLEKSKQFIKELWG